MDLLSGFGRLLDGHDDLESVETLAARHEGLRFPADHAAELANLQRQRVLGIHRNALAPNGLPPAALFRIVPYVQVGDGQRPVGAADLVAGLFRVRVGRILACGQFPAPGSDDGVRHRDRSQRAVPEAEQDGGGILDGIAAMRIGLERLNGDDVATEIAEIIDIVNEVQKDGAGALLASPLNIEVIVRLVEPARSMDRENPSQTSGTR